MKSNRILICPPPLVYDQTSSAGDGDNPDDNNIAAVTCDQLLGLGTAPASKQRTSKSYDNSTTSAPASSFISRSRRSSSIRLAASSSRLEDQESCNPKLIRRGCKKINTGIAGPCCGLAGKVDVLEGHLVTISRMRKGPPSQPGQPDVAAQNYRSASRKHTSEAQKWGITSTNRKVTAHSDVQASTTNMQNTSTGRGAHFMQASAALAGSAGNLRQYFFYFTKDKLKNGCSPYDSDLAAATVLQATTKQAKDYSVPEEENQCKSSSSHSFPRKVTCKKHNAVFSETISCVSDADSVRPAIPETGTSPFKRKAFLLQADGAHVRPTSSVTSPQYDMIMCRQPLDKLECSTYANNSRTGSVAPLIQAQSNLQRRQNCDLNHNVDSECEIGGEEEGDVCLSAFTFGSMDSASKTDCAVQSLDQNKPTERQTLDEDCLAASECTGGKERAFDSCGLMETGPVNCPHASPAYPGSTDQSQRSGEVNLENGQRYGPRRTGMDTTQDEAAVFLKETIEAFKLTSHELPRPSKYRRNKRPRPSLLCESSPQGRGTTGFVRQLRVESAFNMGVGLGVSCVLAANKKETERLGKLLERTEFLLESIKQRTQLERCCLSDCLPGSLSQGTEKPESQRHTGIERCELSQAASVGVDDSCMGPESQSSLVPMTGSVPERRQMAELEAALEAELELMELNLTSLDGKESAPGSCEEYSGTWPKRPSRVGDGLSSKGNDDPSVPSEVIQNGKHSVSPGTLSRRLHEVLVARQEEQILELEARLKDKEVDLIFRERELQCWKDISLRLIESFQNNSASIHAKNNGGVTPSGDPVVRDVETAAYSGASASECNCLRFDQKRFQCPPCEGVSSFTNQLTEDIKTVDIVGPASKDVLREATPDTNSNNSITSLPARSYFKGYVPRKQGQRAALSTWRKENASAMSEAEKVECTISDPCENNGRSGSPVAVAVQESTVCRKAAHRLEDPDGMEQMPIRLGEYNPEFGKVLQTPVVCDLTHMFISTLEPSMDVLHITDCPAECEAYEPRVTQEPHVKQLPTYDAVRDPEQRAEWITQMFKHAGANTPVGEGGIQNSSSVGFGETEPEANPSHGDTHGPWYCTIPKNHVKCTI